MKYTREMGRGFIGKKDKPLSHDEYPKNSSDYPSWGENIDKPPMEASVGSEDETIDMIDRRMAGEKEGEEYVPPSETADRKEDDDISAEYATWPSGEDVKVKPKLQGVEVEQKLDRDLFRAPKQTEGKTIAESLHKTRGDKPRHKSPYKYSGGKSANRPQATL